MKKFEPMTLIGRTGDGQPLRFCEVEPDIKEILETYMIRQEMLDTVLSIIATARENGKVINSTRKSHLAEHMLNELRKTTQDIMGYGLTLPPSKNGFQVDITIKSGRPVYVNCRQVPDDGPLKEWEGCVFHEKDLIYHKELPNEIEITNSERKSDVK